MLSLKGFQPNCLIVLCAANTYDHGVKLADPHFAEHLSKLAPVLYVDPPISCLLPLKNPRMARQLTGPRLRLEAPNLVRLTPIVEPFPGKSSLTGTTSLLLRSYVRKAIAKLAPSRVLATISAWPQFPVFDAVKQGVSIYWAQDDFIGGAELLGWNADHLARIENRVASAADFVVAANPVVADTWRSRTRDVLVIPYGADVDAYADVDSAPLPRDVDLEDPVIGFVGHINSRIDIRILEAIAKRGRSLLLVGPKDPTFETAKFDELVHKSNVRWVGHKPFNELPSYFRRISAGIVPYGDSPFNRSSFPLKTLEYLAAGRPVVSTDLPATRWLATDLVEIANDPEHFADLADHMLRESKDQKLIARRREFATEHSWPVRARDFYEAILTHRQHARA